jgi:hypothetical protein
MGTERGLLLRESACSGGMTTFGNLAIQRLRDCAVRIDWTLISMLAPVQFSGCASFLVSRRAKEKSAGN